MGVLLTNGGSNMRSREELQKALDLYNRALKGDVDANIKIWEFINENDRKRGIDGNNIKTKDRSKKKARR